METRTMLFKRAEGILEKVKVTPVMVNRSEYWRFTGTDGRARMVVRHSPRMIDPLNGSIGQ